MWNTNNMTSRVRVSKNELQPALDLHRFTQVMCSGLLVPWHWNPQVSGSMAAQRCLDCTWSQRSAMKNFPVKTHRRNVDNRPDKCAGNFPYRDCGNIVLRSLVLYRNSGAIWHQKSWSYQDDQVPTDIQCWLSYIISMSHRLNWKNLWDFAFHKVAPSWAPKTCVVVSWDLIY